MISSYIISRIIIAIILLFIIILVYYNYKNYINRNTPPSPPKKDAKVDDKVQEIVTNAQGNLPSNFAGNYMYSPSTDNLFLKKPDGQVYYAGKGVNCPNILNNGDNRWFMNQTSSTENQYTTIQDTTTYYTCGSVSLMTGDAAVSLQTQCQGKPSDSIVYINTPATEIEKNLVTLAATNKEITPPTYTCYPPDLPSPPSTDDTINSPGSFSEYLSKNKDMIIAFGLPLLSSATATKFQKFSMVSGIMGHFFMAYMMIPGFMAPKDTWEFQKNALMTGEIILDMGVTKIQSMMSTWSTVFLAEAAKNTGKGIMDIGVMTCAKTLAGKTLINGISALAKGLEWGGYIQMVTMIVDMFDPCKLNSESMNITQKELDQYRTFYDQSLKTYMADQAYPKIFDPTNICDYKLDCTNYFNNCMTPEQQKQYTDVSDYCSKMGDTDLFNQYQQDYLNSLKVNSSGECIGSISNSVLAQYFQTYVGGADWSFIATMKTSDFVLPTDQNSKVLSLLLANQNVLVAGFFGKHIYYIIASMIIIAIILFVL